MFEPKNKNFTVRLSAAEYSYLLTAAANNSVKPGAFLRLLLAQYKQRELYQLQKDGKKNE